MEKIREIVQFNIIHETNSEPREQHYHQNLDLLYVLEGTVDVVLDDKEYHLLPEDVILINSNKRHKFENSGNLLAVRFAIDYYLLSQTVGTTQILFLCNSVIDKNSAPENANVAIVPAIVIVAIFNLSIIRCCTF